MQQGYLLGTLLLFYCCYSGMQKQQGFFEEMGCRGGLFYRKKLTFKSNLKQLGVTRAFGFYQFQRLKINSIKFTI